MGDIYMTQKMGRMLVKLFLGGLGLLLLVIAVVFLQSYLGRKHLHEAEVRARSALVDLQRAGCERSKKDRDANALGWRTAQNDSLRNLSADIDIPFDEAQNLLTQPIEPDESFDLTAARMYDKIAQELEERSDINCAEVFPKESAT